MEQALDQPQLYLVTPRRFALMDFSELLSAAMDAVPIACIRLDLDSEDVGEISAIADALRSLAHARDIPVVISRHFRLAERLGLDGVHLDDNPKVIRDLRRDWGDGQIIGTDCGTSKHAGMTAGEAGADYVSFGPIETDTDLGTGAVADPDLFAWWSEYVELPVVAEGGLTLETVKELAPKVDFFALGSELWSASDPIKTLKDYSANLS